MVLDLLDPATLGRLVGVVSLMIMAAAAGYAKGFKDGSVKVLHAVRQWFATLQTRR